MNRSYLVFKERLVFCPFSTHLQRIYHYPKGFFLGESSSQFNLSSSISVAHDFVIFPNHAQPYTQRNNVGTRNYILFAWLMWFLKVVCVRISEDLAINGVVYDSDCSLTLAATKSLSLSNSLSKQCGLELDQDDQAVIILISAFQIAFS